MEALADMQIMREPSHAEWLIAFCLSLDNRISIYDATYLGFAVYGQSKMVTADRTLLAKLGSHRVRENLVTLTELSL